MPEARTSPATACSGTASFLRRGLRVACRAAFLTEGSDVVGCNVNDVRPLATGSAAEPHARRPITGCWLRFAHHFAFAAWNFSRHASRHPASERRGPQLACRATLLIEVALKEAWDVNG